MLTPIALVVVYPKRGVMWLMVAMLLTIPALAHAQTGTISGRVTTGGGATGIAGVNVSLHTTAGAFLQSTNTDVNGNYSFTSLNNATYKVRTNLSNTPAHDFIDEIYNNISCATLCDITTIGTGVTITGGAQTADFDLAPAGVITGAITNAANGAPLGISVRANSATGPAFAFSRQVDADPVTGDFRLQLAPGNYYIGTANSLGFVNQLYDGLSCGFGCPFIAATVVSAQAGVPLPGINFALHQGGIVSGRVTGTAGVNLQGVNVEIWTSGNQFVTSGTTQADGTYVTNGGIPAGTFYSRTQNADLQGYVNGIYQGNTCIGFAGNATCNVAGGTPIQITAGAITPNIDHPLVQGGSIAGSVVNEATTLGVAANVSVLDSAGNFIRQVINNAGTGFTVTALPTGDYYLRTGNGLGLVDELYNNLPCVGGGCTATLGNAVHVNAPAQTAGISFALAPGARISGRITDPAGAGIPNVAGQAMTVSILNGAGLQIASTITDASGNYQSAGLPAGTYWLSTTNGRGFINKIYNAGATGGGNNCSSACQISAGSPITLTAGEQRAGIDLQLEAGGRISGRVTRTDGAGIPNVTVQVHVPGTIQGSTLQLASVNTDNLGNYLLTGALPSGQYWVRTVNSAGLLNKMWENIPCGATCNVLDGTPVDVVAGAVTTAIDFVLESGGRISGTVTDSSGTRLPGVFVNISDATGTAASTATTDSQGVYTTGTGLSTGTYFARTTNPLGFVNEIYDNIACTTSACPVIAGTPIPVTVNATLTGIDFSLTQGGQISGTVRADDGTPLAGVSVLVFDATSGVSSFATAFTNGNGVFTVSGLPPNLDGTPATYYAKTSNLLGYVDERWDGVGQPGTICLSSLTCTVTDGAPILAGPGNNAGNIDFRLGAGGRISGTITGPDGPLAGVQVSVHSATGARIVQVATNGAGVYTSTTALSSGTYYVVTSNTLGYLDELYNNIPCLGCTSTTGTPVTVTAPNTANGIDFSLVPGARIRGYVSNVNGVPLMNVQVRIHDIAGVQVTSGTTNTLGEYLTSAGLPTGTYFARTGNPGGYVDERYDNEPCLNCTVTDGRPIELDPATPPPAAGTCSATTPDAACVNFALAVGGRIRGTVRGPGGVPLAGVTVNIYDVNNRLGASGITNASGVYGTLATLPSGAYFAKTSNVLGYIDEIFVDSVCPTCLANSGTPIDVVAGDTTTGVAFDLGVGSRIRGRVSDASNSGIQSVTVQIYDANGVLVTSATSSVSGNFTTPAIPSGIYFARTSNSRGFIDENYNNIACVGFCQAQTGTPIDVVNPTDATDVNFVLAVGGRISGSVLDGAVALPNITVNIYNSAGSFVTTARTNGIGQYQTATGLPFGRYFARTTNSLGYMNVLYQSGPCQGSCTVTSGTPIEITAATPNPVANFVLAVGAKVAGTVRDTAGRALPGVTVRIATQTGSVITTGVTNSAGQYLTLDGLQGGTYFATTSNTLGYLDERYNLPDGIRCGSNCASGVGTPIVVNAPQTATDIDFVLALGGRFSGQVTDAATGNPLRNVAVEITTAGGFIMGRAFTDGQGRYSTVGLPDGSYYAQTNNTLGYADIRSTIFTVTGPHVTPDINFALSLGARIQGRITNASGNGIAGVTVTIFDASNFLVGSGTSGATGHYIVGRGLSPGAYFARSGNNAGYIDELFSNIVCPSCAPNSSTPIVLTALQVRNDVDFTLNEGGRIAGKVEGLPNGSIPGGPLALVTVQAFGADGRGVRSARTDDLGRYEILGLPTGSYFIRTFNTIAYLDQIHVGLECDYGSICPVTSGTPVAVTAGSVTPNIDFNLRVGGRITGVITGASGNGIVAARVALFDQLGRFVVGAVTDGAGRYVTGTGLPSGPYFVIAVADGYLREGYDNQPCSPSCVVTDGTAVAVTDTGTTPASVNFALAPGGRISGIVTEAVGSGIGNPITNAQVGVFVAGLTVPIGTTGQIQSLMVSQGFTDSAGAYITRDGLPPGDYLLRTFNGAGRVNELYDDVPCVDAVVDRCTGGDPVTVTGTSTITGINFALVPGGRIRGRVTSTTGAALPNVIVFFADSAGRPVSNATAVSDGNGQYQVPTGLPNGIYYASTRNSLNYVDEVWVVDEAALDSTCISSRCDVTRGSPITIAAGATVDDINFELVVGGQISGKVTGRASGGAVRDLPNVTVEIYGSTGIFLTSFVTDGAGNYAMTGGLPSGNYFVKTVNALGYADELFNNLLCPSCVVTGGTPVGVTTGAHTPNINFELGQGGTLSGSVYTVTQSSSSIDGIRAELALGDAPVIILQCPGGARECEAIDLRIVARTRTNSDGVYSVSLPPGVYFVQTDALPGYTMSIYRAPTESGGPTPVQPCPRGLCDPDLGSPVDMFFGTAIGQIDIGINACAPISIGPLVLPLFSPGMPYLRTITASGGVAPYGFAVTQGQLPPGLTLDPNTGALTGTTTTAGSTLFTIAATDANGCSGTQSYNPTICSIALGTSAITVGTAAGSGMLTILAAAADCPWSVSSDAPWLTAAASSGTGDSSINYNYQDRGAFSQPRTGTISVGGQTFRVTQNGIAPIYSVTPAGSLVGPASTNASVQITTNTVDATWTATTNVSWITFNSASGTGGGSATFTVARNGTTAARVGSIFVGGQTVTITQRANGIPGDPLNLGARVQTGRARFDWGPPIEGGDATSYLLEAGLAPGSTAVSFTTPDGQPSLEIPPTVPPGRYYFRVKGRNEFGTGRSSEEYELIVGADGTNPPGPPLNVTIALVGGRLSVTWDAPATGGAVSGYVLEAGSGSTRTDIAVLSLGSSRTFTYDGVPPGNFFLRIRALNGAGMGEASAEVLLNAGGVPAPPGAPRVFAAAVAGSTVTFSWLAPNVGGTATSYVLEAGTARGLSNVAVFNTGGPGTSISFNNVPAGVYYVRLRAQNGAGTGTTSNEIRLVVP